MVDVARADAGPDTGITLHALSHPLTNPDMPAHAPVTCVLSVDVGRKNLAVCIVRPAPDPEDDEIVRWDVMDCEPTPAGVHATLSRFCGGALPPDAEVVVERQPPKNPTMTRLQHYIEMFFWDREVHVQDPKHKLSFAASTPHYPADVPNWTYHTRKKVAVQTVLSRLKDARWGAWQRAFDAAKKKDDLADSFLQAQAYVHNVRPALVKARSKARTSPPPPLEKGRKRKAARPAKQLKASPPDGEGPKA